MLPKRKIHSGKMCCYLSSALEVPDVAKLHMNYYFQSHLQIVLFQ